MILTPKGLTSSQNSNTFLGEFFCCAVAFINTHHTVRQLACRSLVSTNRSQPAVLHVDEVGECLLGSEYAEILSDNELVDCAILDVVMDCHSDEDDDIIKDFLWEDVNN
jgi:hypothetical protein